MSILILQLPIKFTLFCRARNIGGNISSNCDTRETDESKQVCVCVFVCVCAYVCVYQDITEESNRQAIALTFNQGFKSLPNVCSGVQNSVWRHYLKPIWKNAVGKNMIVLVKVYAVKVKANDYQFQGSRNQNQLIQKEKGKFDLADEEDTWQDEAFVSVCSPFECHRWGWPSQAVRQAHVDK